MSNGHLTLNMTKTELLLFPQNPPIPFLISSDNSIPLVHQVNSLGHHPWSPCSFTLCVWSFNKSSHLYLQNQSTLWPLPIATLSSTNLIQGVTISLWDFCSSLRSDFPTAACAPRSQTDSVKTWIRSYWSSAQRPAVTSLLSQCKDKECSMT